MLSQKLFDDMAKMAGGAANFADSMRKTIESETRTRVDEFAQRMDLVPRRDLERVEALVVALEKENKDIKKRLDALEDKKKTTPAKAKK